MRGPGMWCQPSDWHPPRAHTAPAMAGRVLGTAGGGWAAFLSPFPFGATHSRLGSVPEHQGFLWADSSLWAQASPFPGCRDSSFISTQEVPGGEGFEEEIFEEGMSSPEPLYAPRLVIKPIYLLNGAIPGCFSTAGNPKRSWRCKKKMQTFLPWAQIYSIPKTSSLWRAVPWLQLCHKSLWTSSASSMTPNEGRAIIAKHSCLIIANLHKYK